MDFPVKMSRNPNIQYELLTLDDVDDVFLFCCKHFFHREPLCMFYRETMNSDEAAPFTQFIRSLIQKGTSYKAVDTSQNYRLVAIKMAQVIQKGDLCEEGSNKQENGTFDRMLNPSVLGFLAVLKKSCDYFSTFAVDSYFMHEITAVREDYGSRGICSELLRLAEQHVRVAYNIQVFVVTTTNVRTQKAYLKAGYQIMRQLDFETFSDVALCEDRANIGCLQVKHSPFM